MLEIGHHTLEGTPYILCRKHHPYVPTGGATHAHILEQHRKFENPAMLENAETPGGGRLLHGHTAPRGSGVGT